MFQAIQFNQTVLIQTIHFSIRIVFVYTQLNVQTVLFQTSQFIVNTVSKSKTVQFKKIQFSIQKQFHFKQFSLAWVRSFNVRSVLFWAGSIIPGQRGPESHGIKKYSTFPKAPPLLKPHHQIIQCHIRTLIVGGLLPLCCESVGVFYSPSWLDNIYKVKLATVVEDDQKTPFSMARIARCRGSALLLSVDYSTLPLIRTL